MLLNALPSFHHAASLIQCKTLKLVVRMAFIIEPWQQQHQYGNGNRQQKFIRSGTTRKAYKPKRNFKTHTVKTKERKPKPGREWVREREKKINKRDGVRLKQTIPIKRWKSKSLKCSFFQFVVRFLWAVRNHGSHWIMCMTLNYMW